MKSKLLVVAVLAFSMNAVLVSNAHALGITQTAVSATSLPTDTVLSLFSGVNKEVMVEAKKHAEVYGQTHQASPFLKGVVEQLRADKSALTSNVSDDAIIDAIAGFQAE